MNTYKIRKKILEKIDLSNIAKIRGPSMNVQIDEAAIYRGRIMTISIIEIKDISGVRWIIGDISEDSLLYFIMLLVFNIRSKTTLKICGQK